MMMATMNVSLPNPMKGWVERQVAGGKYANASDYVRDLIRRDQTEAEKVQALQGAIDDGLASGASGRSREERLTEARRKAKAAVRAQ